MFGEFQRSWSLFSRKIFFPQSIALKKVYWVILGVLRLLCDKLKCYDCAMPPCSIINKCLSDFLNQISFRILGHHCLLKKKFSWKWEKGVCIKNDILCRKDELKKKLDHKKESALLANPFLEKISFGRIKEELSNFYREKEMKETWAFLQHTKNSLF